MTEHENNFTDNNEHTRFWKFLRHPLFIAIVAIGLFGIVIAFLGDYLQHQTWIKQKEIELEKSIQGRVFDKRADILEELFYGIARREQVLKQILFTHLAMLEAKQKNDKTALNKFYAESHDYSELSEELEARSSSVVTAMRIFFDWRKHQHIIPAYIEIHELFNQIHNKILKDVNSGNLSKEDIIGEIKKIDDLREDFHLMFKDILYYPEITKY